MANFSTNQVRHLYVADNVGNPTLDGAPVGTIKLVVNESDNTLYFLYKGSGGVTRSDIINIDTLKYVKSIVPARLATTLKKAVVKLNPDVNEGGLIAGQDYILRIVIRQFAGMSDEDTYIKYGAVHATAGMTPETFYKKLAISLAKNFSRELTPLFTFKVGDTVVTPNTKEGDITGTIEGVVIEEVEQDWVRGIKAQVPVYFDVIPTTVILDGDEVVWGEVNDEGKVELTDGATIGNGKKIADLEYFCMGERGDIYRNVGWPNVIPTKYLVDESKTYYVIELHYYHEGAGENPQKSEKDLTIVSASGKPNADLKSALTGAGITVTEVS